MPPKSKPVTSPPPTAKAKVKDSTAKNKPTKTAGAKRPRGGQTTYTAELADEIVKRLSDGTTLREICRSEHMPTWGTVYDWMERHPDFKARVAHARETGEEAIAMECLEIADERPGLTMQGSVDGGDVQHKKLRIWARLELLKKWNPKKWGEKVDMNHGVQPDNPLAKLFEQVAGTPLKPQK